MTHQKLVFCWKMSWKSAQKKSFFPLKSYLGPGFLEAVIKYADNILKNFATSVSIATWMPSCSAKRVKSVIWYYCWILLDYLTSKTKYTKMHLIYDTFKLTQRTKSKITKSPKIPRCLQVLTTALSIQFFGLELTMTFLTGVVLVCHGSVVDPRFDVCDKAIWWSWYL